MNKSLLFLLSLICLPCFGTAEKLLLTLATSDEQTRSIVVNFDPATNSIDSPFQLLNDCFQTADKPKADEFVSDHTKDVNGNLVDVKRLKYPIPLDIDATTFDLLQNTLSEDSNIADLDQPTTVRLINAAHTLECPQNYIEQLLDHCVDLFIQNPHGHCPFGAIANKAETDNPALYVPERLVEQTRKNLYNHFKRRVLHHSPWHTALELELPKQLNWATYSPDSQHIAFREWAGRDVYIWDSDGSPVQTLVHPNMVWSATYSPDGQHIITICNNNHVYIWNPANGTQLHTLPHTDKVSSATFSPDGQHIITICDNHNVYIWDMTSGTRLHTLPHTDKVLSVTHSPDGQHIITICDNHNVYIWDTTSGAQLHTLPHTDKVLSATYSPDGRQIITICDNHHVYIWDTANGAQLEVRHPDRIFAATFPSTHHKICSTRNTCDMRIWDAITGTLVCMLPDPDKIFSTTNLPTTIYYGGHNVKIRDFHTGALLRILPYPDSILEATYLPEKQEIFIERDKQEIYIFGQDNHNTDIWNDREAVLHIFPHPGLGKPQKAICSPDGKQILTVGDTPDLCVYSTSGDLLHVFQHPSVVLNAQYSPNGRLILVVCKEEDAYLWDAANGTLLQIFQKFGTLISMSIAYSADSQHILTLPDDYRACIRQKKWDRKSGAILQIDEVELKRLAFMTRVALNPHFTAQEIADMQPVYHALPTDQRAWVDRQTRNTFVHA